jgi:hypothetical protein
LSPIQSKEQHNPSKVAALDSSFTACASEAAIRTFAGTEIYYGKIVEFKSYVLSDSQLLVRYQLGINREIAWVFNEKTVNYPISIKNILTSQYNLINKSLILLKPINDSIYIGRKEIRNNKCIKIPAQNKLNLLSESEEVYHLTLHSIFIRFMYGLSSGGWLPDMSYPIPDSMLNDTVKIKQLGERKIRQQWSISQHGRTIPSLAENIHVPIKFTCKYQNNSFTTKKPMNEAFIMEIWNPDSLQKNPDTAIVFIPYPDRYFETPKDSFNIKSVVLKYVFANNRYEIDTSGVPGTISKYVFMGFSIEIFNIYDK